MSNSCLPPLDLCRTEYECRLITRAGWKPCALMERHSLLPPPLPAKEEQRKSLSTKYKPGKKKKERESKHKSRFTGHLISIPLLTRFGEVSFQELYNSPPWKIKSPPMIKRIFCHVASRTLLPKSSPGSSLCWELLSLCRTNTVYIRDRVRESPFVTFTHWFTRGTGKTTQLVTGNGGARTSFAKFYFSQGTGT